MLGWDRIVQSDTNSSMYFPPKNDTTWATISPQKLGWNLAAMDSLKAYLESKHTQSFIILVNGRIAMEAYFHGQEAQDDWAWNSAGKTLLNFTVGIAQQKGILDIDHKASQYLGNGWTSESSDKENLITCRHLLSMTSGLNDQNQLITQANLTYLANAGSRWSYSNVFQKMFDVIAMASHQDFETFFDENLRDKIGMNGYWHDGIIFTIYHSTARSMARFGLLALNNGRWANEQILNEAYLNESIHPSQNINPSYGLLTWLNSQASYMLPGSQQVYPGNLIPNAPSDMFAALGAADQKIYVIPSKKMVIVRMGDAANPQNPTFAYSGFDNELWAKLDSVFNKTN